MLEFEYLKIEQPVGIFLLGKMSVKDIKRISRDFKRTKVKESFESNIAKQNVKEISKNWLDMNTIFSMPIILSGDSKYIVKNNEELFRDNMLKIDTKALKQDKNYFNVIDGQSLIDGIMESGLDEKMIVPTIIVLDTTIEQDAYLYSKNQENKKATLNASNYDLVSNANVRSIDQICNVITRELNKDIESPVYGEINMLSARIQESSTSNISQSEFINLLMPCITDDKNKDNLKLRHGNKLKMGDTKRLIFRKYFIDEEYQIIYRVLHNYFTAIHLVERTNKSLTEAEINILNTKIGFTVKFRLLRPLFVKGRDFKKSVSVKYFEKELNNIIHTYKDKENELITGKFDGNDIKASHELFTKLLNSWFEYDADNTMFIPRAKLKSYLETGKYPY